MTATDGLVPADILAAALAAGLLFLLRFALAMRRIRQEAGATWRGGLETWRDATRPMSFGSDLEPNRRHAARQLYVGLFCLSLGLILAVWLGGAEVFDWPVPFAPAASS